MNLPNSAGWIFIFQEFLSYFKMVCFYLLDKVSFAIVVFFLLALVHPVIVENSETAMAEVTKQKNYFIGRWNITKLRINKPLSE